MAVHKPNESSTNVRIVRSVDYTRRHGIRSLLIVIFWRALLFSFESLAFPSCLNVAHCESVVRNLDMKVLV